MSHSDGWGLYIKLKNNFKINIIFNEKGEALEKIIERAFGIYCLKKN